MDDAPRGCLGSCFSLGCSIVGTVMSLVIGLIVVGLSLYFEPSTSTDQPSAQPAPTQPAPAPAPGRKPRGKR